MLFVADVSKVDTFSDKTLRVQAKLTNILATSKATAEKMQKECTQLHDRVAKLQADLEEQIHQNTELLADNGQKQLSLKSKEEEIGSVKVRTRSHVAHGAIKSAAPPQRSHVAVALHWMSWGLLVQGQVHTECGGGG